MKPIHSIPVALLLLLFVLSGCSNPIAEQPAEAGTAAASVVTLADAAATAGIELAPGSGYAGTFVDVRGHDWPASTMVLIKLADAQGRSPVLSAISTGSDGTFTTGFVYPVGERWLLPGAQTIVAHTEDNGVEATAPFSVVLPEGVRGPTATPPAAATAAPSPTPTVTPILVASAATATPVPAPTATTAITLNLGALASAPVPQPTQVMHGNASAAVAAHGAASTVIGGFQVDLLGVDQQDHGVSTWHYSVAELPGSKNLGYWVLELPHCASIVAAAPEKWETVDAHSKDGVAGIKWKVRGNFVHGEFAVTLSGPVIVGTVRAAAKGAKVALGSIAGPFCP